MLLSINKLKFNIRFKDHSNYIKNSSRDFLEDKGSILYNNFFEDQFLLYGINYYFSHFDKERKN